MYFDVCMSVIVACSLVTVVYAVGDLRKLGYVTRHVSVYSLLCLVVFVLEVSLLDVFA